MNLNNNPQSDELRDLLRNCNDQAGHHVLWVDKDGEVHISLIPKDRTPIGFEINDPRMQVRYETFEVGNDYVGPDAANDAEWVAQLFDTLKQKWPLAKSQQKVEYVDQF